MINDFQKEQVIKIMRDYDKQRVKNILEGLNKGMVEREKSSI